MSSTPRRRATGHRAEPLALAPLPDDAAGLSDPIQRDLAEQLRAEAEAFRRTGKPFTPRKEVLRDEVAVTPRRELIEAATAATGPSSSPSSTAASGGVAGGGGGRRFLPRLRRLFECFGQCDVHPRGHLGLAVLQRALADVDPTVRWDMETPLQRSVRLRVEAQEALYEELTRRARELLAEQARALHPVDEHAAFMAEYRRAQDEIRLGAETDRYALSDIERRAAREAQLAAQREAELRAEGERRKAAAHAAMEQRRREREAKVAALRDVEEEARDDVDAVKRVRLKLEAEKRGTTVPPLGPPPPQSSAA